MAGFGAAPFGASPYGIGTPDVEYEEGGTILPVDGASPTTRARFIDPVTRQFEVDEFGQLKGMDAVQQQMYLALRTIAGEAIPEQLGNEVLSIEDIGAWFEDDVRDKVKKACSRLIAARLVRLEEIGVDVFKQGGAFIRVRWTNLLNGREYVSEA